TIGNSRYKVRWDATGAAPNEAARKQQRSPRSGRAEVVDDDALESCDEPIPLDDSTPAAVPLKAAPAPPPAKPPPDDDRADPLILPDELELAPVSDVIPPPQQPH